MRSPSWRSRPPSIESSSTSSGNGPINEAEVAMVVRQRMLCPSTVPSWQACALAWLVMAALLSIAATAISDSANHRIDALTKRGGFGEDRRKECDELPERRCESQTQYNCGNERSPIERV